MVNYLIVHSTYKNNVVSIMTTNNFPEHLQKFRSNELLLQKK